MLYSWRRPLDDESGGVFFPVRTRLSGGDQIDEPLVVLFLTGVIELDVFSGESVGFLGDETDLSRGEVLLVEGGDL